MGAAAEPLAEREEEEGRHGWGLEWRRRRTELREERMSTGKR
jgi:hypothetical protein